MVELCVGHVHLELDFALLQVSLQILLLLVVDRVQILPLLAELKLKQAGLGEPWRLLSLPKTAMSSVKKQFLLDSDSDGTWKYASV